MANDANDAAAVAKDIDAAARTPEPTERAAPEGPAAPPETEREPLPPQGAMAYLWSLGAATAAAAAPALSVARAVVTEGASAVAVLASDIANEWRETAEVAGQTISEVGAPAAKLAGQAAAAVSEPAKRVAGQVASEARKLAPVVAVDGVKTATARVGQWVERAAEAMDNAVIAVTGGYPPAAVVLTGLPGSGKSTVVKRMQEIARRKGGVAVPEGVAEGCEAAEYENLGIYVHGARSDADIDSWLPSAKPTARGVVFVLDSSAAAALPAARNALHRIVGGLCGGAMEAARGAVLVLANKSDAEGAGNPDDLVRALDLRAFPHTVAWNVVPCRASAPAGDGVLEGLEWLRETL
eukprot:m51a1_g8256 putative adp-ribosylation factor 6 (353) ;mRNA; r:172223-173450